MLKSAPNARETKLAKSLVNPDKQVRDRTLESLKTYVSSLVSIEEKGLLKLWKALYYCMWLADKQEVQREMAHSLANLADSWQSHALRVSYFRTFFQIMMREWSFLDQYRVNKFYMLFRIVMHKIFSFMQKCHFNPSKVEEYTILLENELLTKLPNGVRYHIADIYLDELVKVAANEIDTKTFLLLIAPFSRAIVRESEEAPFIDRIYRSVYQKFLNELSMTPATSSADSSPVFANVRLTGVQKHLFDLASGEQTPERHRKKLYDMHKQFAAKSGVQFVDEDEEPAAESSKDEQPKKAKKQKKSEPKDEPAAVAALPNKSKSAAPVAEAAAAVETGEKKKSKKRKVEQ